jgi:hypothetical protein
MAPSQSLIVSTTNKSVRAQANTAKNKLKVQLKLSISRLRMVQQKDTAKAKQQRREMAQLLEVCKTLQGLYTLSPSIRHPFDTTSLRRALPHLCNDHS